MNLKCALGFHAWDACKCSRCGKVREGRAKGHEWNGCTCSRCGTVRALKHEWSTQSGNCVRCGLPRGSNPLRKPLSADPPTSKGVRGKLVFPLLKTNPPQICIEEAKQVAAEVTRVHPMCSVVHGNFAICDDAISMELTVEGPDNSSIVTLNATLLNSLDARKIRHPTI